MNQPELVIASEDIAQLEFLLGQAKLDGIIKARIIRELEHKLAVPNGAKADKILSNEG
jgi:hypothetical protein